MITILFLVELCVEKENMRSLVLALLLIVVFAVSAAVESDFRNKKRTLVVFDSFDFKQSHSKFLQQLVKKGHKLEYKLAFDPQIALSTYGDYHFDNLIILASRRSCT
jgi:hypothetical protein